MKILRIFLIIAFLFMLSCNKDDGIYPPSDKDNNKNDGDTVHVDEDLIDVDADIVDEDLDITDEDLADDIPDINDVDDVDIDPVDTDPGDNDQVPDVDSDAPAFGCGNSIRETGEECDNGPYNSDLPGDIGLTCRTNCQYAGCGDKIIDVGEMCDDGNILNGDYCDSTCSVSNGRCGDGIVQTNEECDKSPTGHGIGAYCADDCMDIIGSCGDGVKQENEACDKGETGDGTGPFYCAADCKTIIGACGDLIEQANETCDDGENNGRYNYCNATCNGKSSYCGDGVKDYGYEECDDGNDAENDYCTNDCMTELGRCGDGVIQGNEACDNAVFGAGTGAYCTTDCKTVLGFCGDETIQTNEQCDLGSLNGSPFCEYGVEGSCNKCNSVCNLVPGESTFCGDGKIDTSNGETCDKAEFGSGIGGYCAFDCKSSDGYCGDGGVQPNEACDKAIFGDGTGPEYCSADCKSIIGYCGDGVEQTMEECDEGGSNTDSCAYGQTSCTVCSTTCKNAAGITSYCGDTRTDSTNGEFCDSGSNNGKYKAAYPGYCNSDCLGIGGAGYCGDESVQGSYEQCDEGADNGNLNCDYGQTSCSACTSACTNTAGIAKYCGDGNISNGEICDSGSNNGTYGYCKSDCTGLGERCGDGIENGTESCDDGELNGTYGKCSFDCSGLGNRCGDGIQQPEEVCDDGTDNGTYRLNAPGNCNGDCQGRGSAGYCGNGTEELSNEECDHSGIILTDCEYGQTSCFVCDSNCNENPGNTAYCGDGIKNSEESCDDGANNGSAGYCNSACNGYISECGNGIKEGGEICDDGDNNGEYGYCNLSCLGWDMFCGDGIENGTESCDDGGNNGEYGYCNDVCSAMGPYCGDDDINGIEICDDGTNNGNYGYCNSGCTDLGERCGDGIENGTEVCDSGLNNGSYGFCKSDCSGMGPYCGDDDINGLEFCDDAFNNGNYGYCNADCSAMGPYCGDDDINGAEFCDDGSNNGNYGYCKPDCTGLGERCGDGIENGTESCDDGINNGTYGYCKADCSGDGPYCGDGIEQSENEVCDDGSLNGTYGKCNTNCSGISGVCGDDIVDDTEVCDDGPLNGTAGYCKTDCTGLFTICGDGAKHGDESCDDGVNNGAYRNLAPGYCDSDCMGYGEGGYCGDSSMQGAEQCDDGVNNGDPACEYGLTSCNVCTVTCTETPGTVEYCGDGITNGDEVCDDGENNGQYSAFSGPYCSSNCMSMGEGGYCGDETIQEFYEECDEGSGNGEYGVCYYDCTLNPYCGDGNVDEGELCDANDVQCTDFAQFSSGTASCTAECMPDFSTCVENIAYTSPFFTTSQTLCYDNAEIISCPDEGNPFYGQEPQFDYTIQSFTVDSDTITEVASGLIWQKDTPSTYPGCTKGYPVGSKCMLIEASDYCSSFNGTEKWRLPTAFELSNIIDYEKTAPLTFNDFTNSVSGSYVTDITSQTISFLNGTSVIASSGKVKCVSGESQYLDSEVTQSGDLFVNILDPVVPKTVFWQYDSAQTVIDWEDALAYCSTLTEGGLTGFRLPTVTELQFFAFESLSAQTPYADGTFWTSTTVYSTPANAYTVDFETGNVSMTGKTGTNFVICVK